MAKAYVKNPFLAKVKAVSKPIPLELPVTTATFFFDIFIIVRHNYCIL